MAKTRNLPPPTENVISIIGAGMRIVGDCDSGHTIRIEGTVEGTVRAKKGVVIGRSGRVAGDIHTADAKIAGSVKGTLMIKSRLELEASAVVDGEIKTARMKLDEGAIVNGSVAVGRQDSVPAAAPAERAPEKKKPGKNGSLFGSGEKRKVSA